MWSIKLQWSKVPTIGKMGFLFRTGAFTFYSFVVYYHHYSNNLSLGAIDYLSILLLMSAPSLFVFEFLSNPQKRHIHVKHVIIDLFIVGWISGIVNLSLIPSLVAVVAGITNYIGLQGVHKFYRVLYIVIGSVLALSINNFQILLNSDALLQSLSLIYGFIHFVVLSYISYVFANRFYKSNKILVDQKAEINRQHEEIQQQAEELKTLNNSLGQLNNRLEIAVGERTKELNEKNIKLAQHAFFNAHKLRAPLARVIGLIQLFDYRDTIKNEEENVLSLLKISADELEKIVSDINKNLEKESGFKSTVPDDKQDNS